jgi:tetratricopeptide (TPR) repeat protein
MNMLQTNTWRTLENLAIHHRVRGRPAEAIPYMEQAIAMTRGKSDLAAETATMLNYLAGLYLSEGMLDKAEATIRDALPRTAADTTNYADNLLVLAEILHKQNRQREATDAGREGLRLVRQEYGWDHGYTVGIEKLLSHLSISYSNGWFLGFVPPRITSIFARLGRLILRPRL